MANILVTGTAGFIGYHLTQRLLADGHQVVGVDNLNDYYDVKLKEARLARLLGRSGFDFARIDISDRKNLEALFLGNKFDRVVNLAAQAGVRYASKNPHAYVQANILGFMNILEGCRNTGVKHLVFASSSSVYGGNSHLPFAESDNVDHPLSLYAATKKSNELMAHTYAHLYQVPVSGLRFFTVYGPWGRPDMAMFLFTKAILEDRPIDVYNNGGHSRDFTFVDDIVEGVVRVINRVAEPNPDWNPDQPDPASSSAPYRIYNIGNNRPVELMYLIQLLEEAIGRKAKKNMLPMQPGDVPATYAQIDTLAKSVGFRPKVSIEEGVRRFLAWYKEYYRV